MPWLWRHTATKIAMVLTTDAEFTGPATWDRISVPDGFDLGGNQSGKPWKVLDDLTQQDPTDAEMDTATTPEPSPEIAALLSAFDGVVAAPNPSAAQIKLAFQRLRALLEPKPRWRTR